MTTAAGSLALAALLISSSALAAPPPEPIPAPPKLTEQAIDDADFAGWRARVEAAKTATESAAAKPDLRDEPPDPFLIRVQTLLDRAHASPGVIDGRDGDNTRKAVRAFERMRGLKPDGVLDPDVWATLAADTAKTARIYEIRPEDVGDRYVASLPKDYAELAKLKWLGFRDPVEMLAERFHLDEPLLRRLNPGANFGSAGQKILVVDTGAPPDGKVARIVVDKGEGDLRAYDDKGELLFVAPATVGSADTPSPKGTMKVNGSFPNPTYRYDPKKNFQQGKNRRKLNLPAGPNGPVGSMWIDLSKPTYGIHGTPDPSKIDKSESHGCVRLTNWDADALARMVQPSRTVVLFE